MYSLSLVCSFIVTPIFHADDDLTDDCKAEMATMVKKLMGNYQLDMKLAAACDRDVVDRCSIEKNTREEGESKSCVHCANHQVFNMMD